MAIDELSDMHNNNLCRVGWYHSHTGFGLFLSEEDIRTHLTYPESSVAMVVDSTGGQAYKFFTLVGRDVKEVPYDVVNDK
jgi:proteasome lid subunit RPN8/RPN11